MQQHYFGVKLCTQFWTKLCKKFYTKLCKKFCTKSCTIFWIRYPQTLRCTFYTLWQTSCGLWFWEMRWLRTRGYHVYFFIPFFTPIFRIYNFLYNVLYTFLVRKYMWGRERRVANTFRFYDILACQILI